MITLRVVILLVAVIAYFAAEGTNVEELKCYQGNVRRFHIEGCESQPCAIRKGQRLPFELELSFTHPAGGDAEIHYFVFTTYYATATPGHSYGENAAQGDCKGGLGFQCPVRAWKGYTLKSQLYIDPKATCTSKRCDDNSQNQLVKSVWTWHAYVPGDKSKSKGTAFCLFKVVLNVMP